MSCQQINKSVFLSISFHPPAFSVNAFLFKKRLLLLLSHKRSDNSFCLDDAPSSTRPIPPESHYTRLPGELVDADTQCEYDYGTGYRRCPHVNLEVNKSQLYVLKKLKNLYRRTKHFTSNYRRELEWNQCVNPNDMWTLDTEFYPLSHREERVESTAVYYAQYSPAYSAGSLKLTFHYC